MQIPSEILDILNKLSQSNFEGYIVGGCVRDLLMKNPHHTPKDWDIATNALPEQIQAIFPDSVYENNFGTVAIKTESKDPTLKIVEITTFRKEGKYTDKRHPDKIKFAKTIEEDLCRRDFTINAMALSLETQNLKHKTQKRGSKLLVANYKIIDPFKGQKDLTKKIIRAVGNPHERFQEDGLRLMRAIRLACELSADWRIEEQTLKAIKENSSLLSFISKERIRDEFIKIIETPQAAKGILLLEETNLLKEITPELTKTIGVTQNKHHIYTVWEHLWRSLDYAAKKNYSLEVRLTSLFHDIGKPQVKQGEGKDATFYGHEWQGAKIAARILNRLKFPRNTSEKVIKLIRYHQFVYDPEITTDAAIRRLLVKVGKENIKELAQVREADRIGSGCPKALPFRLRHFLFRVEKVLKETEGEQPSLKILEINGNDLIRKFNLEPGPKIGAILSILLEEVLDNPQKNNKKDLEKIAEELVKLPDDELQRKQKLAEKKYRNLLEEEETKIKKKYYV
ncbi:MAG: HD domain-containing protein [Candidatus Pacebacteria bacterium]|nr:HD domain-containing protein [Candidatus Paceibacterota bacterium]